MWATTIVRTRPHFTLHCRIHSSSAAADMELCTTITARPISNFHTRTLLATTKPTHFRSNPSLPLRKTILSPTTAGLRSRMFFLVVLTCFFAFGSLYFSDWLMGFGLFFRAALFYQHISKSSVS